MSTPTIVPFNIPSAPASSDVYVSEALHGHHISGDGSFTRRCQTILERELGVVKSLLTTSCTHALEMSALLLDIAPGDEVIVPSFTFVSTINAFVLRGAVPVFVDIRPDTLNLDESRLVEAITPKTKAIVPVHYAGVGCEMDAIGAIAREHEIAIVEDNAHGLFGRYRGRPLGTFGALATQSFHETKNFQCGEGGALLINDESLIERAEILREKGTNRSRFFRGQVDKYTWVDVGSSYPMSDMLAALLLGQLESLDEIQSTRERIWRKYDERLASWADANGVMRPYVPEHCDQTYHMYYLLMPGLQHRTRFIEHLKSRGVMAVFHYLPLHAAPMAAQCGSRTLGCPVTEDVSDRLVRLPFFNTLNPETQDRVIDAVCEFSAVEVY